MKQLFSFILTLLISLSSYAQTGTVKGFVYDKESGEPIIFTNVILKGTSIGIQTDVNGYYSITKIKPGEYVLSVSNLMYEKFEKSIVIKSNRVITRNIYLAEDIKKLKQFEVSAEAEDAKTTI
ncbi:MAG: carboxypeptidase-like regulatory domain-containing protein, partial [Flavobacteriales bacterium]